jgi:hypothetical protein
MDGFLLLPQMAAEHASAAGMIGFCEQVSLHKSLSFDMGDVKPEKGLQGRGSPAPPAGGSGRQKLFLSVSG